MKLIKYGVLIGGLRFMVQTAVAQSIQPVFDNLRAYDQAHAKPIKPLTYAETRFYVGLHLSIFNQRSFATSPTYLINTNATSRYPTLHGLTLGYEILPRTYLETGIAIMDYQSVFAFTNSPLAIKIIHSGAAFRMPLRVRYQLLKLDKRNRFRLSVLAGPVLEIGPAEYTDGGMFSGTGIPDIQPRTEIKGGGRLLLEAGGEIEYKMSSHFATQLRWSQSWGFSDVLIDQFRYEQQNQAYLAEITSKGWGNGVSFGIRFYLW